MIKETVESTVISVIIPCYNAEAYLQQCLDSLRSQTLTDLQIICIDDGSTDQTPQILNAYSAAEPKLQVITQKNAGISAARNAGLKITTGDYIAFVDADDWLEPDTFEKVLAAHEEDIICFSYYRNFDGAQLTKDLGLNGVFPAELIQRKIVGLIGSELGNVTSFDALMTCWGRLYKRELLANIYFRDLKDFGTWEDGIFNLEVLEKASYVRIINTPYYHYRKVSKATYTSSYKPELYLKWLHKFKWIEEFMKSRHKSNEFFVALQNRIAVTSLNLVFNEMNSDYSISKKMQAVKQILDHPVYVNAFRNFDLKHLPAVWRIFYYFAGHRNAFVVTLMAGLIYRLANRNTKK